MKIYEYNEIIDSLLSIGETEIDEETGLVFDVTLLDKLEMERNEKIENLLLYAAQLKADAEDIEDYASSLNIRAKAKKIKSERIKDWLCEEITRYGDKKFETSRIKGVISIRDKVNITDEKSLPEEYIRTKIETAPDKTAIAGALKAGAIITSAELIKNKTLQIK